MKFTFTIAFIFCTLCSLTSHAKTPNIIIILADDLGYGDLGCYKGKHKTPHLDRMAAEGLRFTDFHSSGSVCSPTRAGLVTGLYQQRTGVDGVVNADPKIPVHNFGVDPKKIITYPKLMIDAGYKVALFGKWHLGYKPEFHPSNFGYDRFVGFLSGNIDYISHYDRMSKFDWWHDRKTVIEKGYSTHLITQHAVEYIKKNKDQPFCIYVAHEAVHSPMQGPDSAIQRGPDKKKGDKSNKGGIYKQMLTELDKGVGQILTTLTEEGLAENTLVLFASDNGPMPFSSAGPLRGKKSSIYEGGHRVPAIAWWPEKIAPGTETHETANSIDYVPTMLSLANIATPKGHNFDGTVLTSLLTKGTPLPARPLFWRLGGVPVKTDKGLSAPDTAKAVREGKWKLVAQPYYKTVELYDLESDLGEKNDVSGKFPEKTKALLQTLKKWESEIIPQLPYKITPQDKVPKNNDAKKRKKRKNA